MNKKEGFTLIELLAVIVILAVILAIAVPSINNIVIDAKFRAFEHSAKLVLRAIDYEVLDDESYDVSAINETNISTLLDIDSENFDVVTVKEMNDEVHITIVGKGKWDGLTVSSTKSSAMVENTVTVLTYGANVPVLATGMTPIKWSGSAWVTTTEDDASWYNYDTTNKQWANATTADGSYWVWIPRYIYKISSGWHTGTAGTIDIQFSKGINDNWNTDVIGNINLGETASASNNTWTNHPAFTFGDLELTGIWVAKFEPTAVEGVTNGYTADGTCVAGDNVTTKTIKIIPGAQSWRCIYIRKAYTVSKNMETNNTYGWGTSGNGIDSHLIKNTEWGAVAYLAKSSYGKTTEVTINNNNSYYTGGGTGTAYTTNIAQTTTGNIYGVYDTNGGAFEGVSAYVENGAGALASYGLEIINADFKYKNIYAEGASDNQATNYPLTANSKGDAMWETSGNYNGAYGWHGDYAYMPYGSFPWLLRGGCFDCGSSSGPFSFLPPFIDMGSENGFRPVIAVSPSL